jgi:DNA polymerase III epsilon subunit-like protein
LEQRNLSRILFVDFETSGYHKDNYEDRSNKYEYQIVSIGAIVVSSGSWKAIDKFYTEVQWNGESKWDPQAEHIHGLSKQHLAEHGVPEEEALVAFAEFVAKNIDTTKQLTLGGHNVSTFDRHFLVSWFDKYQIPLQLSGRAIDTYTLGKVLFNAENSNELFELVGTTRKSHNALEDVELALKVVRMVSKLFKESVK